jgi:hypothetical protein
MYCDRSTNEDLVDAVFDYQIKDLGGSLLGESSS